MKNLALGFLVIVSFSSALAQQQRPNDKSDGQHNPQQQQDDQRRQEEERRRQEEEKRIRAENAEGRVMVTAVGVDQRDCINQAYIRADQRAGEAINQCDLQAQGIMRCFVTDKRITNYGSGISATFGSSKYDEKNSNEDTCRNTSIVNAEGDALNNCQRQYSVACQITSRGTVTDHHTDTRRRYIIMGPKEEHQICSASAIAAPLSQYTTQCSIEVVARTH